MDPEFYFKRYASEDGAQNKLSHNEFKHMLKSLYSNVSNLELSHVFKHFDRGNKGYITKEDFLTAFNT